MNLEVTVSQILELGHWSKWLEIFVTHTYIGRFSKKPAEMFFGSNDKLWSCRVFSDLKLASITSRMIACLGSRNVHISEMLHSCFTKYLISQSFFFPSFSDRQHVILDFWFNLFTNKALSFSDLFAFMQKKIL